MLAVCHRFSKTPGMEIHFLFTAHTRIHLQSFTGLFKKKKKILFTYCTCKPTAAHTVSSYVQILIYFQ